MVDSTSKDEATTTPRPTGDVSKLYDAVDALIEQLIQLQNSTPISLKLGIHSTVYSNNNS